MASSVLWHHALPDGSFVVANWNKLEGWNQGRQYTVDFCTAPHPVHQTCQQILPTRYYATAESAVRAAKRLAKKHEGAHHL